MIRIKRVSTQQTNPLSARDMVGLRGKERESGERNVSRMARGAQRKKKKRGVAKTLLTDFQVEMWCDLYHAQFSNLSIFPHRREQAYVGVRVATEIEPVNPSRRRSEIKRGNEMSSWWVNHLLLTQLADRCNNFFTCIFVKKRHSY